MPADSSLQGLYYKEEATFTPGAWSTSAAYTEFRYAGESLKQNQSSEVSDEIDPSRLPRDFFRHSINAGGNVRARYIYGAHDDIILRMLMTDTGVLPPVAGSYSTSVTNTGSWTVDGTLERFEGTNIAVGIARGDWIRTAGFTNAANNGVFRVAARPNADALVVTSDLVTEGAVAGKTVKKFEDIVTGKYQSQFSLLKVYSDLTNKFAVMSGQTPGGWSFSAGANRSIEQEFIFLGSKETSTAVDPRSSTVAAATNTAMNSVDNLQVVIEGLTYGYELREFSFQYTNNLRAREIMGLAGAKSVGKGDVGIQGSFVAYMEDRTVLDKFLDNTASAFAISWTDAGGNKTFMDWPRIAYTDGDILAERRNQDLLVRMSWVALKGLPPTEWAMKYGRCAA